MLRNTLRLKSGIVLADFEIILMKRTFTLAIFVSNILETNTKLLLLLTYRQFSSLTVF